MTRLENRLNPEYLKWIDRRYMTLAIREGWTLSERDDGVLQVQKLDDDPFARFSDDTEAMQHVMSRMLGGSHLHSMAYLLDDEPAMKAELANV